MACQDAEASIPHLDSHTMTASLPFSDLFQEVHTL
jgi:hypothetical protein